MLKLKSFIYRKTGIYLAQKEELKYLISNEFWAEFDRMSQYNAENELTNRDLQGLLIGMWQIEHRFHRRFNFKRYRLELILRKWLTSLFN